jgi:hypothetical protein
MILGTWKRQVYASEENKLGGIMQWWKSLEVFKCLRIMHNMLYYGIIIFRWRYYMREDTNIKQNVLHEAANEKDDEYTKLRNLLRDWPSTRGTMVRLRNTRKNLLVSKFRAGWHEDNIKRRGVRGNQESLNLFWLPATSNMQFKQLTIGHEIQNHDSVQKKIRRAK